MPRGLIVAARHARPRTGARICFGRTDVPLATAPDEAAARLLAAVGEPVERVISSPLARALDIARAVGRQAGAPVHADDRLTDRDFGAWEGVAWAAVPRAERAAWEADALRYRPGGGESLHDVLARVRRAWTRIGSSEETTLVVTHEDPIRCLLHVAGGLTVEAAAARGISLEETVRFETRLQ